ncbi:MAG: nucleotidyltransferase family protein [Gemmatimonadales bacterium]
MTTALIMAGGRGERMRAGGRTTPKPLVPIGGIPLLERNVLSLLHSGFQDLVVAVPSEAPQIAQFVRGRCQALAAGLGARLELFQETTPLGNIGAAAVIERGNDDVLVVYADNLTALDLNALVRHHRDSDSCLTAAVHVEPTRIPYGEVELTEGLVTAYREKPEREVVIASGLYVLRADAIAQLPQGRPRGASWLVNRLLEAGLRVAAFPHDAAWIDVNDEAGVERAERLVAVDPAVFDPPRTRPASQAGSAPVPHDGGEAS